MTHTCDDCGTVLDADRDKSRGVYRDRCLPCIEDAAADERHVDTCERENCKVCADYRKEFGGMAE